jgi:hypothetical protein
MRASSLYLVPSVSEACHASGVMSPVSHILDVTNGW